MAKKAARRTLERAMEAPWAILEPALESILAIAHRANESPEAVAAQLGKPLDNTHQVTVRDGVATIPVAGPMFRYANLFSEISGATSYEVLGTDLGTAIADPDVKAILLAIDSPGGEVNGAGEMGELIYKARGKKPIIAHVGGFGASAAYWIASAADRVICAETALLGSIGVIMSMTDDGGNPNEVEFVSSQSPNKVLDPATREGRARIQTMVDQLAGVFVANVARNRGVTEQTVLANYGKGDLLVGRAAVRAGLADAVATFEATHAQLAGTASGPPLPGRGVASALLEVPALAAIAEPLAKVLRLSLSKAALDTLLAVPAEAGLDALETIRADADQITALLTSAAPAPAERPHPPAPVAAPKENQTMPDAPAVAENPELDRVDALVALASENEVPHAQLQKWLKAKTTVATASAEVMAGLRTKLRSIENPDAEELDAAAAQAAADGGSRIIRVGGGVDRISLKPFASFGEQMKAVIRAGRGQVDPRLRHLNERAFASDPSLVIEAATPSGMNESVGSEGGFFIQPELLPGIIDPVYKEDPIVSRVNRIPIAGNGVKFNVVDETARTTGNRWGGIQMFWVSEADTAAAKKPKLREIQLDLKKLMGIGYLTNELMADTAAAEALLLRAFQAEVAFMLGDGIFRGPGAGQPLGFMNSGCKITQAIEATQTIANSNQFISANVAKMQARVPASLWGQIIWLYNQELLNTLINATIGTSSAVPLFIPIGGLGGMPSDTILGRPAFASELCEAVGTPGDIVCVVPSQYFLGEKGGINQLTSLHVRFLYDEQVLRITYRVDGQPGWYTTVTPYKGANARSPFVVLNTRA